MGIESKKVFDGIKRILEDETKSLTADAIYVAYDRRLISQKDANFYIDIRLKRNLSEKQEKWKVNINRRVLFGMRRMPLAK